jgi:hypothetical protein
MTQLSEGLVRASRWAAYPESAERAPISPKPSGDILLTSPQSLRRVPGSPLCVVVHPVEIGPSQKKVLSRPSLAASAGAPERLREFCALRLLLCQICQAGQQPKRSGLRLSGGRARHRSADLTLFGSDLGR